MNTPTDTATAKKRRLLLGVPMMVLGVLVGLVIVPMAFVMSGQFQGAIESAGVHLSPDMNDGKIIAEFEDPAADLLRQIPPGESYEGADKALDIRRFSVKKVAFRRFSGIGIEPRLNLVFYFDGVLPNPLQSDQGFSLPVIHVYIKAPNQATHHVDSDKLADVSFDGFDWDYQVVIDGFHDTARIFDTRGELVAKGVGLFVTSFDEVRVFEADKVTAALEKGQEEASSSDEKPRTEKVTRITAALPMELLGDPEHGEWKYAVVVGLADLGSPSMLYPSQVEGETEIFDSVLSDGTATIDMTPDGRARLTPLVVTNAA